MSEIVREAAQPAVTNTKPKHKISLYGRILIVAGCIIAGFAALAVLWPAFCDAYTDRVFPYITIPMGWVVNLFPFAVGEVLMYAGAAAAAVAILLSLIHGGKALIRRLAKSGRRGGYGFYKGYMKVFAGIVVAVLWLFLFQWWIPYHGYVMGVRDHSTEVTLESLRAAREAVAKGLNSAMTEVPRDASGKIIYPAKAEREAAIETALRGLADRYPRLNGYYARPKEAICSDVLEWMRIGGYTYPYTTEVTYNRYVDNLYWYSLVTHETAHRKGFYKENEACFMAFLACLHSDDPLMRYSGLYDVWWDIDSAYWETLVESCGGDEGRAAEIYLREVQVDGERMRADMTDAEEQAQELYEEDSHPLEDYREVASDAADVGWEVQADLIEGVSYSDVVKLIAEYYKNSAGK